jgi:hypothetical protein
MLRGLFGLVSDLAQGLRGIAELHPAALSASPWSTCDDWRAPAAEAAPEPKPMPQPKRQPATRPPVAYVGQRAEEQL